MNRKLVFDIFIISALIVLIFLFVKLSSSFLIPFFWAAVLSLSTFPLYRKLKRMMRGSKNFSAFLMTTFTSCIVIIPVIFLLINLGFEAYDLYETAKNDGELKKIKPYVEKYISEKNWERIIPPEIKTQLENRFNIEKIDIASVTQKAAVTVSNKLIDALQNVLSNFYLFILNFAFTVFVLFFMYRDGEAFTQYLKEVIPMKDREKEKVFGIFYDTINSTVIGTVAVSGIQAILITLIFFILGVSFPIFSGALTFVLSFLPFVGAATIWIPVSIFFLVTGSYIKAAVLLLFGAIIISSVDNLLRPIIIGGKLKLNTLFLFISILGGLELIGFSGIIVGPLIVALLISFIEIYKLEFINQPETH